jgi:WD40 repeat protein
VYNQSLSLINSFNAHNSGILRIKQSSYNIEYVATASFDKTVKIWNQILNWQLLQTYTDHFDQVFGVEFINRDTIASGSTDGQIHLWSISKNVTLKIISTNSSVRCLSLLSNGFHLATGLANSNINIYDTYSGSLVLTLRGHTEQVNDLILISNGNLLASSSDDKSIRVWDLNKNTAKCTLLGHINWVYGLKQIYWDILSSGSYDSTVKLWNITSCNLVRTLDDHRGPIYWSVDVLNDAETIVSGCADGTVTLWNIESGLVVNSLNSESNIYSLAVIFFKF